MDIVAKVSQKFEKLEGKIPGWSPVSFDDVEHYRKKYSRCHKWFSKQDQAVRVQRFALVHRQ